jgi:hypothetical protein
VALPTEALGFGALLLLSLVATAVALARMLATPTPRLEATPSPDQRLVARKVLNQQGTPIGETVRVTPADLVVLSSGTFLLVPRSHIQEYGPDIMCDDGIDWEQAARRGEAWRKEHEDQLRFDEHGMLVRE